MNKVEKQIKEIREAVEHCTAVQDDGEPCYHCKQKRFLLEQIEVMGDVVAAMSPGPQVSSDPDGWGISEPVRDPGDPGYPAEAEPRCVRCNEIITVEGDEGRCLNCT